MARKSSVKTKPRAPKKLRARRRKDNLPPALSTGAALMRTRKTPAERNYKYGPGKPPPHTLIKKGEVRNPLGARAHNKELKSVKRLTKDQLAELGSYILDNDLTALDEILNDPKSSILRVWFAAIAVRAIRAGDAVALNQLLDRIVGKCKESIELTGANGGPVETDISAVPREERLARLRELQEARDKVGTD